MNYRILMFLFVIIGCLACSPQKSLKRQNYDRSFETSLKALSKHRKVSKNKGILNASLVEIINKETPKINQLNASPNLNDREEALFLNLQLQTKIVASKPFLNNEHTIELEMLHQEAKEMKTELAQLFLESGKDNLSKSEQSLNKTQAQKAYLDFERANIYGIQDENIDFYKDRSLELGLVVYHIELDVYEHYEEVLREFNKLERLSNIFREIHVEPGFSAPEADCHFKLKFLPLDIDYERNAETKTYTKTVKTGWESVRDTSGNTQTVDIYEEVCGTVSILEKSKIASLQVLVDSPDNNANCISSRRFFSERYESETKEVSISGDKRAIPSDYRNNNRSDCLSSDSYMASRLIDDLYYEIYHAMNRRFNRQLK